MRRSSGLRRAMQSLWSPVAVAERKQRFEELAMYQAECYLGRAEVDRLLLRRSRPQATARVAAPTRPRGLWARCWGAMRAWINLCLGRSSS